jgi:hypothetical protein
VRPLSVRGLVPHEPKLPPSTEQVTVSPASVVALQVTLAVVWRVVPTALEDTVGLDGGVPSATQLTVDSSLVPPAFLTRTAKLCQPSARPVNDFGEVQAPQSPPSVRHSNDPSFSPLKVTSVLEPVVAAGGAITGAAGTAVDVTGPSLRFDTETGVPDEFVVPSPS